ncbi:MAG: YicC/YloC family endoribonuclease, partial [Prosthecobacter sp.]|nr:YicC/YloC family endoribonuclease [Prosthecobacter sp.]
RSMTGFGRGEASQDDTTWQVECGSVNRKQLEVVVHLPRDLAELEAAVRSQVSATVSRGRVNVQIRSGTGAETAAAPRVDEAIAAAYVAALQQMAARLGLTPDISLSEIARLPGVITQDQTAAEPQKAWPAIEQALAIALTQMVMMRESEGAHLRQDIEARLTTIELLLNQISEKAPAVAEHHRQALQQRLEQAGLPLPLDDERLLKEVALFADRTDISEELSRADSHLKQFRTYLASTEPTGRSLDFLVQEFFREFNTMGSKANSADIAHCVVNAKTELEKIREQIQNAE